MLDERIVLVTGATRGIGKAVALTLGAAGATVIGTATTESGADNISKVFAENNISGKGLKLDVTDSDQVSNLVKSINENFGSVDILVNNAGITKDNILLRMKEDEWEDIINTNLSSIYKLSKSVLRGMIKKRSGRIISRETLLTRIEHWLRRYKSKHRDLRIRLQLHEENVDYITNDKKNILRGLMWKNFVHIKIETNKDIGRDEFRFIRSKTGKDITDEMSLDKDSSKA